jgi:sugar (pentulose or hexulose) kinase
MADQLGLPESVQVVIAGHDDIVAAYGAGGRPGDLIDSGGTAEGLVRIVDSAPVPAATVRARMAMARYYIPGSWALVAGAGSTGALLRRVAQMLGKEPAALDDQAAPKGQYAPRTVEVRLSKERLPSVKLHSQAGAPEVWSAVLDLVSERMAQAASRLERLAGRPSRLVLLGGQARSRELVQRKAERLDLLAVTLGDVDATSRGAAALALAACVAGAGSDE